MIRPTGVHFTGQAGYKFPVVNDIELTIAPGDRCLLLGPNGAGKTTLLKTMAGIIPPWSGSVENYFRKTSIVPQAAQGEKTFPLTVEYSIELAAMAWHPFESRTVRRIKKEMVEKVIRFTGLSGRRKLLLRECSGGELQRVFIARALVTDPDFIILDEPTGSIDRQGKDEVMRILKSIYLERNTAILMTSHEVYGESEDFFNRIILVESGKLTERGSV